MTTTTAPNRSPAHGSDRVRVGVVGGRGVVGAELMRLLASHPRVDVVFGEGDRVSPADVAASDLHALFLAAPNGVAASYVSAIDAKAEPATALPAGEGSRVGNEDQRRIAPGTPLIVDLSSDFRFDDAWTYGLPERNRARLRGAQRIANPGCYATGAQLGLDPFVDVMHGVPAVFGVSGYSGAGTKPSPKNDPARLADNLLPYDLVEHTHEREIARYLQRAVAFMPHVAPFHVGITLTITIPLAPPTSSSLSPSPSSSSSQALTTEAAYARVVERYASEPLVHVQREIPEVRDARGKHGVTIGGVVVNKAGTRLALVVTLDNLLKGAATQAVQNMNLALGLDELLGIPV